MAKTKLWQETRAEAWAETAADSILIVFRVRGIAVSDADRQRILAQKDPAQLQLWLEKTSIASSVAEVLDDPAELRDGSGPEPRETRRTLLDLTPLFLRGAHGDTIRVAGVRIGDAAMSVERRALTGAEEDVPDEPRTDRDGSVYRTASAGPPVEIPLAKRVDATLQRGGVLRCEQIELRVKYGRIESICIRGPSLASLEITCEADIARRFGAATGHQRALGWHIHHYSKQGFAIAWHDREHRLEHVALGGEPWQEFMLGAEDLLAELIRAFDMLSKAGETAPPEGSARVRYQCVAALAHALGLGTVPDVLGGRFLEGELSAGRRRVLQEVAARGPLGEPLYDSTAETLFTHLLHYRRDVDRVVCATSGLHLPLPLCCDPILLGMIVTQNKLGRWLEALMMNVDRWLCKLLDPELRTFELRSLIAHHGWPDASLQELENAEI
ncbi:MAG TPA: hypothetical protein VNO30_41760 [Kofleriaceae bacterium]|nr:hypothetical protein [Kofleriaceae bacterium]